MPARSRPTGRACSAAGRSRAERRAPIARRRNRRSRLTRSGELSGESERFALAAMATRDDLAESWHFAAAAVATPEGRLVARLGDPGVAAFLRSAAKPFQALPLVVAGGCERFQLEPAELALVCASHSGTDEHVARVAALLGRGGFGADDLLCGPHAPYDEAAATALRRRQQQPTRLHNNCSGKHAGMLLACRLLDLPAAGYADRAHPLQLEVLEELARCAGLGTAEVGIGIDGCSVPAYSLPLSAAARAYAVLADPDAGGLDDRRSHAIRRIVEAMTEAPGMVAGPGRFTTRLMEVTGGRVLGKEGAAGFYAVAVRGPVAMGLALKIADGSDGCRDGVVIEMLRQLGVLGGEEFAALREFHSRTLRDWNGDPVGRIAPDLELREA